MTFGLVTGILTGDRRSVARAATLVERGEGAELLREIAGHTGRAKVIGITGPPGAGKSTFTDGLLGLLRGQGLRVAVLAVDPSSLVTGGAILGDRIRMQQHHADEGVFIRSMATRGAMGGLAPTTRDMVKVFDAAGFDVVLVETVGVGQDEVEVARVAQCVVLLLVPGAGDEVQAIKAGIMEMADVFVVNKADLAGAEKLVREIEAEVEGRQAVVKVVAKDGVGIGEAWAAVEAFLAAGAERRKYLPGAMFAIDHLGVAVESIEGALGFYRDALGMRVASRETVAGERVHVAMLPAGAGRIELLEASEEGSTIAKFIEKRGEGLHHVALRVPDLAGVVSRLKSQGVRILNDPRQGAGGHWYVFVHPASTGGVLLELIEEHE
jgi:LAO/AO transport system kinase